MTTISLISSNYNVVGESEILRMDGSFVYNEKIGNMELGVYKDGNFIGNISYNFFDKDSVVMNLDMTYMIEALNLLNTIITDIKAELGNVEVE